MKNHIIWLSKCCIGLLFIIALSVISRNVLADSSTTGSGLSFTVKTNLPDNQIDKNNDFYQLKMTPGQQQTVTATIYNVTKKDTTVNLNVQTASTTTTGTIDYSKGLKHWDKSLKYILSDMVDYPKSVKVPAGQSKEVSFKISMPTTPYKGILLGGITFAEDDRQQTQSSSATVRNKYAYAVAMVLKENDEQIAPNINLKSVVAGQNNGHNVINIKMQNDRSLLMSNVKVKAKIYSIKGTKPVYTSDKSDMQFAPNSQFIYPVSLQGTAMNPGKYRLQLEVTGTAYDKPKTWQFTKVFSIKGSEAKQYNRSDVDLSANTNNTTWQLPLIIGGVILLLVVLVLLLWIIYRRKNAKKQ